MGSDPKDLRPWSRAHGVMRRGQAGVDDPGSDIFFAAIEASPVPMVLSDPAQPDNPIVFANPAFSALTGYGRGEILGRNCRFLQGVDTDPVTIEDIRGAIRGRHEMSTEVLNYRKDGSSFWNALFVSPVFDGAGELVYFFASQLDVSRRREAEAALRGARVAGTVALQAGGIAHDFNNLLQVISGTAESLMRRAGSVDDPRLMRQLGIVAEAADRAAALTRRLAALAHEEAGDGRAVDLNGLVDGLRRRLGRTTTSDVRVTFHLGRDVWIARLDPPRVEAALLDLVSSALAALPGGSVLTLETGNLDVTASGDVPLAPGPYATVRLSAGGARLPALRSLAERSGGGVHVEGRPDHDAAVRLCFPAVDRRGGAAPSLGGSSGTAKDERILVVDDRHELAELARTMLEDSGYAVEIAVDGEEALAKLDARFDLLFSDLVMPGGMDGLTLARQARLKQPALKVLLTTGQAEPARRSEVGDAGFATIAKPYRRSDLARRIRLLLDGSAGTG